MNAVERCARYLMKVQTEVEVVAQERDRWRIRCEHAESMLSDEQMAEHVDVCNLDTGRAQARED